VPVSELPGSFPTSLGGVSVSAGGIRCAAELCIVWTGERIHALRNNDRSLSEVTGVFRYRECHISTAGLELGGGICPSLRSYLLRRLLDRPREDV